MQKEVQERILLLIEKQQSLLLSTVANTELKAQNQGIQPYSSYAPFVCDADQQVFYLFLSDLSEHSHYLRAHSKASILIIEDEADSEQIFARLRVQYHVQSELIEQAKEREKAINAMHQRFGDIIDLLSSLSDFRVFKLSPTQGRYVEGFGRAFNITQGLTEGITPAMQDKKN